MFDLKVDHRALLAVLNSRLTTYWFVYTFDKHQRGTFPQFKSSELTTFPIPDSIGEYADDLAGMVDDLTDAGTSRAKILSRAVTFLEETYGIPEKDSTVGITENDWARVKAVRALRMTPVAKLQEIHEYFTSVASDYSVATSAISNIDQRVDNLVFDMFGLSNAERAQVKLAF